MSSRAADLVVDDVVLVAEVGDPAWKPTGAEPETFVAVHC